MCGFKLGKIISNLLSISSYYPTLPSKGNMRFINPKNWGRSLRGYKSYISLDL